MLPGAAERRAMVARYAREWAQANEVALQAEGPLWVALGDSTAQGVGASAFDRGYVGQLLERLRAVDDARWRVVNVSASGARLRDVLDRQLSALRDLALGDLALGDLKPADLVTCAAGANDLLRTRWSQLAPQLNTLLGQLPTAAVVATLPAGLREHKAARANALIRADAPAHGLRLADVHATTGPPWAGKYWIDHFHPSDAGYRDWAEAFARAIGVATTAF
jgi:lysophospholipase L1-like esterase